MNFFPFSTFGATLEEMNTEMRWSDEICLEHPRSSRGGGGEGKISLFVQMTSLFECRNIFKIFNNGKPVWVRAGEVGTREESLIVIII